MGRIAVHPSTIIKHCQMMSLRCVVFLAAAAAVTSTSCYVSDNVDYAGGDVVQIGLMSTAGDCCRGCCGRAGVDSYTFQKVSERAYSRGYCWCKRYMYTSAKSNNIKTAGRCRGGAAESTLFKEVQSEDNEHFRFVRLIGQFC